MFSGIISSPSRSPLWRIQCLQYSVWRERGVLGCVGDRILQGFYLHSVWDHGFKTYIIACQRQKKPMKGGGLKQLPQSPFAGYSTFKMKRFCIAFLSFYGQATVHVMKKLQGEQGRGLSLDILKGATCSKGIYLAAVSPWPGEMLIMTTSSWVST